MTINEDCLKEMLAALVATGGPFDPAATWVGLATTVDGHGDDTIMSDVTEPAGALAVRKAITAWTGPFRLADGRWAMDGNRLTWKPTDSTEQALINNWFYADALTAGNLLAFSPAGEGYFLEDEFSELAIIPRLAIDAKGNYDATVIYGP